MLREVVVDVAADLYRAEVDPPTDLLEFSDGALLPPAGANDDLVLFDDRAQQQRLNASLLGVDTIDLVAVDSNTGRRPLGWRGCCS